jgi:hypothetical protein
MPTPFFETLVPDIVSSLSRIEQKLSPKSQTPPGSTQAINQGALFTLAAGVSQQIFDINEQRLVATAVNSGNDLVYLNFSNNVAVTATGIMLVTAGGAIVFGRGTDIPYTGRVYAISALGSTVVTTETNIQ